ncbi:MAG: ribonuclease H-like domain-containing protein, partial [Mariprofundaceae bacterium]
ALHQVVAISYAHLRLEPGEQEPEIMLRRIGSGGDSNSSECELLEAFFNLIKTRSPHLISFHGQAFDLPVLKYRAMVHGLSCPHWFSAQNHWQSADTPYDNNYHTDLAELLSDYSQSSQCNLQEIATAFSIPSPPPLSHDEIQSLYEKKDILSIRNHCEVHVCSILLVFLRWKLFQGHLNHQSYARTVLGIHNYLASEAEARPHLDRFLQAWNQLTS